MRGRCFLIPFILLLVILLSAGCVKKYGRSDIASYAGKLTGRKNLTVSEGYQEIQEDEEGYLDHLWTVTDEDTGMVFHVLDDYYWALEEVENQLLNDYDSAAFLFLLESGRIPSENGVSLKRSEQSGMQRAELSCSFTDMAGLTECYSELQSIRKAVEEAGFPGLKVAYTVKYKNPLRGAVDYPVDEGDTTGELGSLDEDALALMKKNYLVCALDYRFESALDEFTRDEIDAVVHSPDSVRIYKGGRADSSAGNTEDKEGKDSGQVADDRVFYEGMIGSPKYNGISFGTLYELLLQEGRKPEGTPWHFTCTGQDGSKLEFSYDFHDLSGFNDKEGRLKKGYYYLRDDRKIRISAYYANHFEASEIEALTGIKVAEDRPYVTGK